MPELYKDLPIAAFVSHAKCKAWWRANHNTVDGLWIKFAKKATGIASVSYEEAREVAIIYGWIDGLRHAWDAEYYAIRFTPRRKRSKWSKINREIAEQLMASGAMRAAGRTQVEAAQADGRWEAAYDGPATMQVHPELQRALARNVKAKKFFATVSAANRYAILYNVHDAKRDETRARRIDKYVAMLAAGDVPHPDR